MTLLSAAAWVPDDDPERDWSVAAGLAVEWVEDRCREEGASGVLVTHTLDLHVPELEAFASRHTRTTRLARQNHVSAGRPVLSYVPHAEDVEFALRLSRKSSLAVVETVSFPLRGWAAQLEATNLLTETTTPPLDDSTKKAVERLAFYGNNGFGDPFGKQQARSILSGLANQNLLDIDLLVGSLLATGAPARGMTNLKRLADKLS